MSIFCTVFEKNFGSLLFFFLPGNGSVVDELYQTIGQIVRSLVT